jgi:antitoxin component YwqK of YwqJK toxin-antitoxin module
MFNKIIYMGLLAFASVALNANNSKPLDESNKIWVYEKQDHSMVFIKEGGRYIRGDMKIEFNGSKTKKTYFPNGNYKSATSIQGNSKIHLEFYPSSQKFPKKNIVSSSRIYLHVAGSYLLHDYMRVFSRNSRLISLAKWRQGELNGEFKVFSSEGGILEMGQYENGIPVGEWKKYYPNGKIASLVSFPTSILDWTETENYVKNKYLPKNSKSIYESPYIYPKLMVETWYSSKGYRFKEVYYEVYAKAENVIIKRTGEQKSWDSTGDLVEEQKHTFNDKVNKMTQVSHNHTYINKTVWWGKSFFKHLEVDYPMSKRNSK